MAYNLDPLLAAIADREEITDDQLDVLRIAVLTEQERRRLLDTAPEQVAAIQQAHETAQGIEPPTDGDEWDPDVTYRRGARVTEAGISYTSMVPYNRAWRPSLTLAHAWQRDAPEPQDPGGIAPWAAGVAYTVDALVTHDGKTWEAKIAHTSHDGWKPSPDTHAVWALVV